MFSERALLPLPPNALYRALAERRARGEPIVDLTISNPTIAELPYDPAIAAALSDPRSLRYEPDPLGMRSAREIIAGEAGVDPDRILLTASTSEAYSILFSLLCDPGDEVLVPRPSYPLLADLAHLAGVQLAFYPLRYDGRWRFDAAELWDAISDRTRAIVAVSPNNPTGSILAADELEVLGALGVPLIVDEVFAGYELEGRGVRASSRGETLTFSLGGLSKTAALPQLKLAWTITTGPEAQVREAMARLELIADTFLSPSTPPQVSLRSLIDRTAPTRRAISTRCASNLARVRSALAGTALDVPRVEGGWYAPIRLPATRTDEEWALALLARGVHAHPGYFYDFPDAEAWLVISLLCPEADFARGVEILRAIVAREEGA